MSLKGSIKVAGDKSITHRAIIFSSLSKGKIKISNEYAVNVDSSICINEFMNNTTRDLKSNNKCCIFGP